MNYIEDINYKILSKKEAYKGKRVSVDEIKYNDGNQVVYREHVKAGNAVIIMAITEDDKVLMVREPRSAIGKIILGLPAGKLEQWEDVKEAALRELEEETGYKAHKIEFVKTWYTSCGYTDEKMYLFMAEKLEKTEQHLDFDEKIEVYKIPLKEFRNMIDNNEIITASTIIAGLQYFLNKKM